MFLHLSVILFIGGLLGGCLLATGVQVHSWGGEMSPGPHPGAIPGCIEADTYCCEQYKSYWNAFLYLK